MKQISFLRLAALWAALLGALTAAEPAAAQHVYVSGHWHGPRVGVAAGAPLFWPYYYPERVYYPPVVIEQPAPVYVEQPVQAPVAAAPASAASVQAAPQQAAAQPSGWWYYCQGAKAYYPYVSECPGGWTKVAPTPAQ